MTLEKLDRYLNSLYLLIIAVDLFIAVTTSEVGLAIADVSGAFAVATFVVLRRTWLRIGHRRGRSDLLDFIHRVAHENPDMSLHDFWAFSMTAEAIAETLTKTKMTPPSGIHDDTIGDDK